MSRRKFLQLAAAGAALAACRRGPHPAAARGPIRAVAFDLFTLFDPRSVGAAAEAAAPGAGAEFANAWRGRQFEYAFLRAAAGQYVDFERVTDDALVYAARARGLALDDARRRRLVDAYVELALWPDSVGVLRALRGAGLRLAPLANYSPRMLRRLLARPELAGVFEHELSTDAARTFKPDPRAYQLGVDAFRLPREQIAFAAFGGWDAAGATWFGYPTFWVNRLGVARDELVPITATGPDLTALAAWIRSRA